MGTIVLTGDENWYGVGHNAVCSFDGVDYLVFHAYDASDERGRAKLCIEKITWDEKGWPSVPPRSRRPDARAGPTEALTRLGRRREISACYGGGVRRACGRRDERRVTIHGDCAAFGSPSGAFR